MNDVARPQCRDGCGWPPCATGSKRRRRPLSVLTTTPCRVHSAPMRLGGQWSLRDYGRRSARRVSSASTPSGRSGRSGRASSSSAPPRAPGANSATMSPRRAQSATHLLGFVFAPALFVAGYALVSTRGAASEFRVSAAEHRESLRHVGGRWHGRDLLCEVNGRRLHFLVGEGFGDVLGQGIRAHSGKERPRRTSPLAVRRCGTGRRLAA